MKRLSLLITFIFLFGAFSIVPAQNGERPDQAFAPPPQRPNILQELGLSRDQIQELRRINTNQQPQLRQAQRNLKEANEALDEAIYADDTNDEIIKERVRAVQQAQSEVIKHRTFMEMSIRKVLTKPQLIKFRELRENFQRRQANQNKRPETTNPRKQILQKRIGRPNQRP
jgi:Spy/CpxP family protein refolding chaperone